MWANAILKGLLIFFRAILIPVMPITTGSIGCLLAISFGLLIPVYLFIMHLIWLPFSLYIMSTSWLYQKVFILRPILAIISIPLLVVLDVFLSIMANPDRVDKYNKALIIDSWPFSTRSDIRHMPIMSQ